MKHITIRLSMSRVHEKLCSQRGFYILGPTTHIAHTSNMGEYAEVIAFSSVTGVILLSAIAIAIKVCRDDRARVLAARAQAIRKRSGMWRHP